MKRMLIKSMLILATYVNGQTVVINEFVSNNVSTLQDEDGDYSDWIELYNTSNSPINLLNYRLSDDANYLNKWIFPELIILPHSHLLVFASGKNRLNLSELHTNFKISSNGEDLYLSDDVETVIDRTHSIELSADESYCRILDGIMEGIVTIVSTPGSSNISNGGIWSSHPSGFYESSFELELNAIDDNQQVHYTLNGEIPTVNSKLYSEPISIYNISQDPYSISGIPTTPLSGPSQLYDFIWEEPVSVYKCNVIRYAAFEGGNIQSEIYSKTYFVDPEIKDKYDVPIVSIVTDSLNFFDYESGIYIPGKRFDEEGFSWWPAGNYHNRGELWERDIHITLFNSFGEIGFETNAGIRMRGNASAPNPQKSFNVYFRNEYGMNKTSYPVFNNPEIEYYKRLIFRNSGSDFLNTHFRDAMLQEIMSNMDLENQDFKPSILFINGEYWGIHNVREKYDKYYFKYKYGINENEVNILKKCGEIEEGSNVDYYSLVDYIEQNDISSDANYLYVSDKLDINNFIDFQIAEIYYANYDWPCNNFKIWKDNQVDSKWRFLIYDLDFTFGFNDLCLYSKASMEHATSTDDDWPHCECSNVIFRKLLNNEDFRNLFISKFADHLETTFNVDRVTNIISEFKTTYENMIEEHIARWSYPASVSDWEDEIETLKEFAIERPCYMTDDIINHFDLADFDFDCSTDVFEPVRSNNLVVFPNPNNGNFFLVNNYLDIKDATITIVSSNGTIAYEEGSIDILVDERKYFELPSLPSNTYVLQVMSSSYSGQMNLVVVK